MGVSDRMQQKKPPPASDHPITPLPVSTNGHGTTSYGQKALQDEIDRLAGATEGTRNDTLNRATFNIVQLVNAGHIGADEAYELLGSTARRIGLTASEIAATLRSAAHGAQQKPRLDVPDPDAEFEIPPATVIHVDQEQTAGFWNARPELSHIREHARARRVAPWALLGITLARVTASVPPFVVLPALVGGHASLNLFVGIVGSSGAGKGGAESAALDVLDTSIITETFTVGSGEAIAHAYMERRYNKDTKEKELHQHNERALFSVAEIDTLAAMKARQSSTTLPELRKAWMGERLGFHYVDKDKRLPVPAHQYRLCLIAGIQPERADVLLDDADGGTPQRFIWVPALDADAPDTPPAGPKPLPWHLPHWGFASDGKIVLSVCQGARDIIDQARLARLRGHVDALDGHALLARLKVAAALALLDRRTDVGDEDWQLAGTVMAVSDAERAGVVNTLSQAKRERNKALGKAEAERTTIVAETLEDAAIKRVCRTVARKLERAGEWVSASPLRQSVAGRDRSHFEGAVNRLEETGLIEVQEIEYQGRVGSQYRLKEGAK